MRKIFIIFISFIISIESYALAPDTSLLTGEPSGPRRVKISTAGFDEVLDLWRCEFPLSDSGLIARLQVFYNRYTAQVSTRAVYVAGSPSADGYIDKAFTAESIVNLFYLKETYSFDIVDLLDDGKRETEWIQGSGGESIRYAVKLIAEDGFYRVELYNETGDRIGRAGDVGDGDFSIAREYKHANLGCFLIKLLLLVKNIEQGSSALSFRFYFYDLWAYYESIGTELSDASDDVDTAQYYGFLRISEQGLDACILSPEVSDLIYGSLDPGIWRNWSQRELDRYVARVKDWGRNRVMELQQEFSRRQQEETESGRRVLPDTVADFVYSGIFNNDDEFWATPLITDSRYEEALGYFTPAAGDNQGCFVLEDRGETTVFRPQGLLDDSRFGVLFVAVKEGTHQKYVLKVLNSEDDEDHAVGVYHLYHEPFKSYPNIYKPRFMLATKKKWTGLEDSQVVVYPYIEGVNINIYYKRRLQQGILADFSLEFMNYLVTTAGIIADLKEMKLLRIWDISGNNVILQKGSGVKLTDYTEMRYERPLSDLHSLIYLMYWHFYGIRQQTDVYAILPEMIFSRDQLIDTRVKELLATMNEKVASNSYNDDIVAYIEDLRQVRDILMEDRYQNPNAPASPTSRDGLQQSV